MVGYHAVNLVELRIRRLDAVGAIVDAVVAAGANVVRDLHVKVGAPADPAAEARGRAFGDAAAKAR